MSLYAFLILIYVVLIVLFIFWVNTCQRIDRQAIVKNSIELMVMVNAHFTDSEKLRLLVGLLNDIDFSKIPEWEKKIFLEIIEKKQND